MYKPLVVLHKHLVFNHVFTIFLNSEMHRGIVRDQRMITVSGPFNRGVFRLQETYVRKGKGSLKV